MQLKNQFQRLKNEIRNEENTHREKLNKLKKEKFDKINSSKMS
jgi:hypothetical protein